MHRRTLCLELRPNPAHDEACESADGDAFATTAAWIAGDELWASLSYGGGCATHTFTLCWPDQSFAESYPVQAGLELLHDDGDDPCDGVVTEDRSFDLGPLRDRWREAYQANAGEITIHFQGFDLSYTF